VEFDAAVPPHGEVSAGTKQGVITSVAPDGDRVVALALLPLDRDGTPLGGGQIDAEGISGRVVRKVGEDLPQPGA
jgi:hypothetical protein